MAGPPDARPDELPGTAAGEHRLAARVYDFRLPETLDRTRIRGLRVLYEVLAHRSSGTLATRLRVPVNLALGELEQHSWGELSGTLPEPTCLFAATLPPLSGRVVLHIPLPLALVIVDLRMGGNGKGRYPERALTEIEQRLVAGVADDVLSELPAVFAPLATLQVGASVQVASVQFLPPVRPTEMYLLVPLTLGLDEETTFPFELCFPFSVLHPLADALATQGGEDDQPSAGDSQVVMHRLLGTPVDMRVRFPSTTLTPADFLHLAVGDVIGLSYDNGSPLSLVVGNQHHLDVLPTTNGKRLACVVIDPEEKRA